MSSAFSAIALFILAANKNGFDETYFNHHQNFDPLKSMAKRLAQKLENPEH